LPPVALVAAASFVLGVLLHETNLGLPFLLLSLAALPALLLLQVDRAWRVAAVVFLLGLAIGLARAGSAAGESPEATADFSSRWFQGRVLDVPRHYPAASLTRLELTEPASIVVWASLPTVPRVEQGDLVRGVGTFRSHSPDGSGARGFAASRGSVGELRATSLFVTGHQRNVAQQLRLTVTDRVRASIRRHVPEPAGAFSVGVLLGDDGAMTEATRDAFRVGGLTHLTAVSGLHTGLVAGLFLFANRLGLVHRWYLLAVTLAGVWSFAYLVGMRPSVTRASLMLTIFVLAQLLGRPRDTLSALALATAAIILVQPGMRFDIGFQLSVAATLGIALALPFTQDRSPWHLLWVIPLAAEIAVEPLILYHFGYYSLVSPFANVLAAPFVAAAMLTGAVTVLASLASYTFGEVAGLLAWGPARAVVAIADGAAAVPFLSGEVEPLSWAGVLIAYVILAGFYATLYLFLRPAPVDADSDLAVVYRV
jgi:competence protein ComEC